MTVPRQLEVTLHGVAHGGEAVGRVGELVAFVAYGLPGERVVMDVTEAKPRFLRGRVATVIEAAPERVTPPCPIYGICGGCHWQHAAYPDQLRFKTDVLRNQLERLGRFVDPPVQAALASPEEWHYRNTVQLIPSHHRTATEDEPRRLCFQRAHSHEPVPVAHCYISDPLINRLIDDAPWEAFASGTWQRLSGVEIRVVPGEAAQVTLVGGRRPSGDETRRFVIGARAAVPQLTGLLFAARRGDDPRPLWAGTTGSTSLSYTLAGDRLDVPPGTFVQVNLGAAELIVDRVLDWLEPVATDAVLDLYAGVGAFSLPLARRSAAVIAVESHPRASAALAENAAQAGLMNVQVQTGLAEEQLPRLTRAEGSFDLAVVDPPRRGCSNVVLDALVTAGPRRIAYVSCEPSTLARDLRRLVDAGYRLQRSGVVDLFPQTYHLESVTLLERASSA